MSALDLVWLCKNCGIEADEPYCGACGRWLTTKDLIPQRPPAAPDTSMSGARPAEGDEL